MKPVQMKLTCDVSLSLCSKLAKQWETGTSIGRSLRRSTARIPATQLARTVRMIDLFLIYKEDD
jgi:hypothetical protein